MPRAAETSSNHGAAATAGAVVPGLELSGEEQAALVTSAARTTHRRKGDLSTRASGLCALETSTRFLHARVAGGHLLGASQRARGLVGRAKRMLRHCQPCQRVGL